ncbi:MAG: hypothetical protein JNK54_08245 [Elusimicrobia bacterium]|jgi:SAM-dependent methyltransferase|nr:hypothetical protein [Elusimicrobiota bacterium]
MGLGPAAVKLNLELWQRNLFSNVKSIIEMGSQELHLTPHQFEGYLHAAGITSYDHKPFSNLNYWPGDPRCPAKPFYQLLGVEEYRCIDLNHNYGAIPHDLNLPFTDSTLLGQFDMVTDHGTNEHVFNIGETYRTVHRLCKPGGIIHISQCLYGGNGFHNFDLSFFESMAAANGYRVLFSSFLVTLNRKYIDKEELRILPRALKGNYGVDQFYIPLSNELLDILQWSKDGACLGICYVFQKQSKEDFRYAYQCMGSDGNYAYRLQFFPNPPSRSYVPLLDRSKKGRQRSILETLSLRALILHVFQRVTFRIGQRIESHGWKFWRW